MKNKILGIALIAIALLSTILATTSNIDHIDNFTDQEVELSSLRLSKEDQRLSKALFEAVKNSIELSGQGYPGEIKLSVLDPNLSDSYKSTLTKLKFSSFRKKGKNLYLQVEVIDSFQSKEGKTHLVTNFLFEKITTKNRIFETTTNINIDK